MRSWAFHGGLNSPDASCRTQVLVAAASPDAVLNPCERMRPSSDKYYRVKELTFYNVITTVLKEYYSSFSRRDLLNVAAINKDFLVMILNVARWLKIDFMSLCEPRFDYKNQLEISHHRVEMASRPWYILAWIKENVSDG